MIEIEGIQFKQATDASIVSYSGSKHVLIANGDTVERVLMSEFAESGGSHDHTGEDLRPSRIFGTNAAGFQARGGYAEGGELWLFNTATGMGCRLWGHSGVTDIRGSQVKLISTTFNELSPSTRFQASAVNSVGIYGTAGQRSAVADAWNLWACSVKNKENIKQIEVPVEKVKKLNGITFTQDGASKTGITAEDLETTGLPGAVHKDAAGEYESVNFTVLIPLLVEAVKLLETEIADLKLKIK